MPRPAIPNEQLDRIQPIVDDLVTKLRTLVERLPSKTDSALVFELRHEDHE
jgi:hypothetical protein